MTASTEGYSRAQIVLHWLVALLIVPQFLFEDAISTAWRAYRRGAEAEFDIMVPAHVAAGALIFGLVVWRLVLRARRGAPPPPETEPYLQRLASRLVHAALYLLLLALPFSGAAAWFGGIEAAAEAHEVMKSILFLLVLIHVVAALYHQLWLKNGLMDRMRRPEA